MLEPTKPGFTETVWESRPPEQLARDLVTGAGAVPAAEAGLAWTRLSVGFAAAALEYERILVILDNAWESKNSGPFIERIKALRDWLAASASAAAGNATQAESHAAAYELAKLTMPDVDEVEKLKDVQQLFGQLGPAIGPLLLGGMAAADTDAEKAKAEAARVMRTYEAATESLAKPWEHQAPPQVTAGLTPTEPTPATPVQTPEGPTPVMPAMPTLSLDSFDLRPMPLSQFRATTTVQENETTAQRVVTEPVTVQQTGTAMAPTAMGAGGQDGDEEHVPRAGLVGAPTSDAELGLTSGMQVAPAVLGGVDPAAQRVPVDIAFNAGSTGSESATGATTSGGRAEGAS
ncbi:PPE domain-containing protein [Nocardia yunnanensis]|uniref:PPE domain-containing protein n=1 Tax=Nocardia yunnanensis TaxID=2382165 RepID=A0A386ZFE0_9NOCA|nr:PPE domain-containing protein [Nocardia yunnanensis]AYF76592.1 PPE domain-containing protein [Nocardia yunnanensis]